MIADNVKKILENIDRAAPAGGEKVTLVGVTKTRSVEEICELVSCGVTTLGENRVQEYRDKCGLVAGDPSWHIIGSLQTNKLKYIIGQVAMIQSVDSVHLARAIGEMSVKRGVTSDVLMEVNISGEESKHGFRENMIPDALEQMSLIGGIRVKGLMMMAPATDDRRYLCSLFEKTRNIYDNLMDCTVKYDNITMSVLSMGMSSDYIEAVECGSNMVRIGTALFI
ncbi:MAG: YggS family pyridoxal phosphate-dependent enzyme [Eubacteriaceae bacterium]|nr:YggS family pyridoxal phosphate-dependent enzyme [Eubacteriaceae bacterium]